MSEFKGTPGEWFKKRDGWSTVYIESRIRPGVIQEIAACGPTEAGPEQQEANANLIVAAPALLKALQAVTHLAQTCIENITDEEQAVIDSGLGAIRKALGGDE